MRTPFSSRFAGKLALITGAGSGIGKATAELFARYGARLVLCDLNAQSLNTVAEALRAQGCEVLAESVDVSDWQAMQQLAERVQQQVGTLDILVNNAGVATSGDFLSTPISDWHWVMGINLMGVVHGCKAFAPAMVTRRSGQIINVASAAGYYAAPEMSAYSASKHAVMGLSESLRLEMAEFGIGVTAICPGVINTNIVSAMRTHGALVDAQARVVDIYRKRNYGPEKVAEAIAEAVVSNPAVLPVSPEAWALYAGKRLLPGMLDRVQRTELFRKLKP